MKLAQLLSIFPQLSLGQNPTADIEGICADTREFKKGHVFVAIKGGKYDGHQFVEQACMQGAVAVVVEDASGVPKDFSGAVVVVENSREALDRLSGHYYNNPSKKMFCVGVTGTNGKTTTCYMLEHILKEFGWKTGVMGTVDHHIADVKWTTEMTTPGPLLLQKRLGEFVALGASASAMEVSSHALDQHRADSVAFDAVIFTNLTRDHLDYHQTMESYFAAKERLFIDLLRKSDKQNLYAVINSDDSWGRKLQVYGKAKTWFFGQSGADFSYQIVDRDFSGTQFLMQTPFGESKVKIITPGIHNVMNTLGAMAGAMAAGVSLQTCVQAMSSFRGVPGRLESVRNDRGVHVFVDYAHTPDALIKVLSSLNEIKQEQKINNRIITLFGCGGDRDCGKRPLMAEAAALYSDEVIVTSDNPRTENPQKIIDEIIVGFRESFKKYKVEIDRRSAIELALKSASPGDVVLIAGKGHEDYQIIGATKIHFSDVEVASELGITFR